MNWLINDKVSEVGAGLNSYLQRNAITLRYSEGCGSTRDSQLLDLDVAFSTFDSSECCVVVID